MLAYVIGLVLGAAFSALAILIVSGRGEDREALRRQGRRSFWW